MCKVRYVVDKIKISDSAEDCATSWSKHERQILFLNGLRLWICWYKWKLRNLMCNTNLKRPKFFYKHLTSILQRRPLTISFIYVNHILHGLFDKGSRCSQITWQLFIYSDDTYARANPLQSYFCFVFLHNSTKHDELDHQSLHCIAFLNYTSVRPNSDMSAVGLSSVPRNSALELLWH